MSLVLILEPVYHRVLMRRSTSLKVFLKVSIPYSLLFKSIASLASECLIRRDNIRAHVAVVVFLGVTSRER